MEPETRSRRLIIGLGVYAACLVVYGILAGDRLWTHTPYNHFALLADSWIHGRLDLAGGPPSYSGNNDFALFEGKSYISFPPFPALLALPLVWVAGSPENFRDGQFFVWLAPVCPAVMFLVFEKLRRTGRSLRTEAENIQLALLLAFGTVYFFASVQGTVWYAAEVVAMGLGALFILFALDAERPLLAGVMLGALFLTRPPMILFGALLVFEALRVCYKDREAATDEPGFFKRLLATENVDLGRAGNMVALAAVPALACVVFASWWNHARFHTWDPSAMGHEHLTVGWAPRIKKWGLMSYHFLPRNLGCVLTSLPWRPARGQTFPGGAPFIVSGHGLALWFTTPLYLWLARPARVTYLWIAAALAAAGPVLADLLYQNSGWFTFGYRFSNDYAVLLFVMLAVSVRRFGVVFWVCAVWALTWNLFGAISFERPAWSDWYSHDPNAYFPPD
jgi:hypothetical protein